MGNEIVTVTPAPSIDWTMRVDSFEVNGVNRITTSSREAAGKGINVSRAVGRAGLRTRAIFPAGGDSGRFMNRELDRLGIPHEVINTGREVRTNVTLLAPGSATKINEPGTPLDREHLVTLVAKSVEACRDAAFVMFCGTLPDSVPGHFVNRFIEAIQAQDRPIWVDTSGPALAAAASCGPALIKPNAAELAELTGRPITTFGDVVDAARQVLAGPGAADAVVLASLGADGSMLISADEALLASTSGVPMVNTVGAGDALLAGFAAATVQGMSNRERLAHASVWASSAVASETTSFEVDPSFADNVQVDELRTPQAPLSEPVTAG